jgi:hypothetical protein
MEETISKENSQLLINDVTHFAAQKLLADIPRRKVIISLVEMGIPEESATTIVDKIESEIEAAKKSKAHRDILYGALWCIGGLIVTLSGVGVIAWGAILFGGIQLFRGLLNS